MKNGNYHLIIRCVYIYIYVFKGYIGMMEKKMKTTML